MGDTDPTSPQPVVTRSEDGEAEVDRAIVWVVQRRKTFLAVAMLVVAGVGFGWSVLQGIQAEAEERVLRRQAADRQARAVLSNGVAVGELHTRMGRVESDIASHAEMTRLSIELLIAGPKIDGDLRSRAAGFVTVSE